jgi:hypothetical protein
MTNVLLNLPYNAVIGALSLPNKTNKPLFCISLMEKLMNGRIPVLSFVSGRSSSSYMDQRDLGLCSK